MTPSLGATIFWRLFAAASVIFMLSPLLLVIVFSFGKNELATLPLGGLTTQWYQDLFANPNFLTALRNSLIVTVTVGLVSTVTGVLAALAFARWRPGAAEGAIMLLSLPVMMPPLVLALALATSFSGMKFQLGLHTVIPSHVIFTQPFVILVVYAQLASFNFAIIDSARDLGATPWHAFRTILLPLVSPAIIGAALLAMAVSLDDFVITFFTIGNGMTLPTLIWGMLRKGLDPSINALGTLILAATIGASALALGLTKYRG